MPRASLSRWKPLALWLALGASFFGSLLLAAHYSPRAYDWRRMVMSSLASPRDNPHAYPIACAGLALSGTFLLPYAGMLRRRLGSFAPVAVRWGSRLLVVGAICLTCSAVIVPGHYRMLGLGRTHEHLAQISGTALGFATILYLVALLRLPPRFARLRPAGVVLVLAPVTALVVSRLALLAAFLFFSQPVHRAIRSSVWNSLALWEWTGAISIYLFLAFVTFGVSENPRMENDAAARQEQRGASATLRF